MNFVQRSKQVISLSLAISMGLSFSAYSQDQNIDLPDMGTVAGSTLTIAQEKIYGDAYMRMIRANQPVINDPVVTDYINSLGHKLVTHASNVKTPFTFFLIQNKEINAFAFFGGYVALHSGLFLHTQSESELASVLAHEISHVTQRHLARSMEAQASRTPATIAALAGSLLLAIAAPQAGIAAITATTAGTIQSNINYTRANEKEADRFGIDVLAKSGFDPYAMPRFFNRLADEYRYASQPPEMLLTHPLPLSRITDSRERARHYKHMTPKPSLNYRLTQARIIVRYMGLNEKKALAWLNRHDDKDAAIHSAMQYGKALLLIDHNRPEQALPMMKSLLNNDPLNLFYLDTLSDLYMAQNHPEKAISMLKKMLQQSPNNDVLMINYASALVKAAQYKTAIKVLQRYTHENPNDTAGWSLLSEANGKMGNEKEELASRAELYALKADWNNAIQYYTEASGLAKLDSLEQARYDARIDQLMIKRNQFLSLQQ